MTVVNGLLVMVVVVILGGVVGGVNGALRAVFGRYREWTWEFVVVEYIVAASVPVR